jgi:asparagine synthase (glutamine-hydrolysing)
LPALRVSRGFPHILTTAGARIAGRIGVASEAKAAALLGRDGPSDGWQLSRLQREVIPAPAVSEMAGCDPVSAMDPPRTAGRSAVEQFRVMVAAETALYLQAMLLPDADSFSMTSSVELRVPFVDGHVFGASLSLAAAMGGPPGKAAMCAALGDPYLRNLAALPKRGFTVPMRQWMSGPLQPALVAANDPDAAVWSVVDREAAKRAGLVPVRARERWAQPWALAALNAWLETIDAGPSRADA